MNKEESLILYKKGREAWNAWAREMLAQRNKLMETGQWMLDHLSVNNLASNDWLTNAIADFSGHTFKTDTDFSGFLFPGDAGFTDATFRATAWFAKAWFHGDGAFEGVTFGDVAGFGEAKFSGAARFDGATFSVEAWFGKATFNDEANFEGSTFCNWTGFKGAEFRGNTVFNQATFEGFTDFSGTIFRKEVNFIAIKGKNFFTLEDAVFFFIPDFRQAHFEEAPQLDNTRFHNNKSSLLMDQDFVSVNKYVTARWRALKRLATQGHDHERELNFLAEEIKSLRDVQDKLLPNPFNLHKNRKIWPGAGRYWAGLFYQLFSDFGRSTFRPFIAWAALTFAFGFFYFSQHSITLDQTCEPYLAAIHLSIHNGLVIPGLGRSEMLAQSYACLYGTGKEDQSVRYTMVFASFGQTVISTVLIFLFLLGLRNYFRIK